MAGSVAGMASKPRTRATSSMRSTSRETSGRKLGTLHTSHSPGLRVARDEAEALEDRVRLAGGDRRRRGARSSARVPQRHACGARGLAPRRCALARRPRAPASVATSDDARRERPRAVSPESTPRSKRWLDSVCRPWRRAARRTPRGSKYAHSRSTRCVSGRDLARRRRPSRPRARPGPRRRR